MKKIILFTAALFGLLIVANPINAQVASMRDSLGTAPIPKEIQDPENIGINKEPAHATLMPYADLKEALVANRHASTFCRSLNGKWKFNWVSWPQARPVDFYKPEYNVSGWKEIAVPSNWQLQGYGTPYYRNHGFTFQKDFPRVMTTPPKNFTAYAERNPVGSYRRDFVVPENWDGRRIFVSFDGVDAGFFLWINGHKVGYSVNSRNVAEFDITKYAKPGKNSIAAEVYRYVSGSYLEDQDMWRLSGIFRNVTLWSAPQQHIRDFFIKTYLDAQYKDATIHIVAKVKNYDSKASKAAKVSATLYNGSAAMNSAFAEAVVPALQPGQEVNINLSFVVNIPKKWTAETPNLYTTVLTLQDGNRVLETLSARTGFRKIEIKGRVFLVNGSPIKLKGVNRHENEPETGHYLTEAQMIRDIKLIKQGNCNHVRTSHYTNDPRWYELCDQYGIWLVGEANVESHGLESEADSQPTLLKAIVDRNVANAENLKNHSSVIIWSLGNETGHGIANFREAMAAVKAIDNTRPILYERFGIGEKNPSDIESSMYSGIKRTGDIATDASFTKPFYLCEYAHAMFNSMGSLDAYNDLFDRYETLLGGAIWEWQDQGIYNKRDPKRPIIAYGGGFGEFPNDNYFIHKGVVASDRSLKPHYPEMKRIYQWIKVTPVDLVSGKFEILNKYSFIDLSGFSVSWVLSKKGLNETEVAKGEISIPTVAPGQKTTISIPYKVPVSAIKGEEYFVKISFTLAKDEIWAPKGYDLAVEQFEVPVKMQTVAPAIMNPVDLNQNDQEIIVTGTGFKAVFDKVAGTFSALESDGVNMLLKEGGPKLHLWRAQHRNDDKWASRSWEKKGLQNLKTEVQGVAAVRKSTSEVEITAQLQIKGKDGFSVSHKVVYSITGDGVITAINSFDSTKPELALAHLGVRMLLDKQFDQAAFLGRGPMENYGDRKQGSDVGIYKSSVKEQLTPYEKPMEAGNHEDVRWASVTSSKGAGLMAIADSTLLQVSMLPYSDEEMENVQYRIDLPPVSSTVFCINYKTVGVGSNSCGPAPLQEYRIYAKPITFIYKLKLL
jgi:beta-galactosidase